MASSDTHENLAIEVKHLEKRFGTVRAVDGISFSLKRGEVLGLLGGNGAGKTTTIGMIVGLVQPTSGSVHVFGADMAHQRYQVLHRMNFESPYVDMPHRLSVRQNLKVFALLYGVSDIDARIAELSHDLVSDAFSIARRANRLLVKRHAWHSLKSLINSPDLLLLDEPTASLDPDTADWIRTRIETYRAKTRRKHSPRFAQYGRSRTPV